MGGVKRWRGRGPSVTIRVDEAAAKALEAVPQAERRAFASAAIISALKNKGIKKAPLSLADGRRPRAGREPKQEKTKGHNLLRLSIIS